MAERCGHVEPFWVQIGWVHWAGTGTREKLMSIDRRHCAAEADAPTAIGKFTFPWCAAHAAEMTQPMTRTIIGASKRVYDARLRLSEVGPTLPEGDEP